MTEGTPDPSAETTAVRVTIQSLDGSSPIVLTASHTDFDANDRGVQIGTVLYPWHRVISYVRTFRQELIAGATDAQAKSWLRLRADDGSSGGTSYSLPVDRFEADQLGVTLVVERGVVAETGELAMDRIVIPWARVLEYERVIRQPETA